MVSLDVGQLGSARTPSVAADVHVVRGFRPMPTLLAASASHLAPHARWWPRQCHCTGSCAPAAITGRLGSAPC